MQPPKEQDYYRVLQVAPNATVAEIKAAYRRLALLYHPDKEQQRTGNQHANAEKFRNIRTAQEKLCNEYTRRTYDLNYAKLSKEWDVYEAWKREQGAAEESYASSSSSKVTSDEANEWDELVACCTQTLFLAEVEVKRREMEHRRKTSQAAQVFKDLETEQHMVDEQANEDLAHIARDTQETIAQLRALLEFKLSQRRLKASKAKFDLGQKLWEAQMEAEDRAKAELAAIERAKADVRDAQARLDNARANARRAREKEAQEKKERAEAEAKQNRAEKERLAEERSREAAKRREAEEEKAAMERLRKEQERERLEEERLQEAAEEFKKATEKALEEAALAEAQKALEEAVLAQAQKEKEERDRKAKEEWEQSVLDSQEAHRAAAVKRLTKLLANDKIRSGAKNPPDWPRSKGKGKCSYCGKLCPDFTFRCPDMKISACNVCRKHVCRFCTVCLVLPATHLSGCPLASDAA